MNSPKAVTLYLRTDGSLLLVKADHPVEIQLAPRQLLDLGFDALRVALALDPSLGSAIADVLDHTYVLPHESQQCPQH